ncbi:Glyoxalase/Bleomycin resistance protein/Dioxygenase superfamily protein [Sphingobium faniae]|nr:Glyoxalase/Bleomycin resistance protein/Dioxygenase superfamily protein [Sphingobium faniae]
MVSVVDNAVVQICFIVPDLDVAMQSWKDMVGAGPFFVEKNLSVPVNYRGTPSFLEIHVGLGQIGSIQLELIELTSDIPSVYRDMFPEPKAGGFHHVAVFVEDIEREIAALEAQGHSMGARGEFAGTPFAYMDTRSKTGAFTELYQYADGMQSFYGNIAAAARGWDGDRLVRPMSDVL